MERVTRFELATYALARRRSTAELNPQKLAPAVGFEPTTLRLTAGCSTVELCRNHMVGDLGFEPRLPESESGGLPLP
jgi:hypothetical protein